MTQRLVRPAWGLGLATLTQDGQVLDTWYPAGHLGLDVAAWRPGFIYQAGTARPGFQAEQYGEPGGSVGQTTAAAGAGTTGGGTTDGGATGAGATEAGTTETGTGTADLVDLTDLAGAGPLPGLRREVVHCEIDSLADPPADAYDAYLRLHLLSHRLITPHQANMDGIFGVLANVAWTSAGPCPPPRVDELRLLERRAGRHLAVYGVDKFPRMLDYVVPPGVRVADADRVRLGAHLAAGTTVMHEGFVNYNAGTLGSSMVEGRVSAGVVVGDGSDIGGGASIMGTLSGGGKEVVRIGRRCLLGANSGIGISLGDDCVVEAGCYVTAGAKVRLPGGETVKAAALSGRDGLLFRRNSLTGTLEVVPRAGTGIALNEALHAND